ncbi:uncharacterized protein LOC135827179 [Sycon ciliatum]|uniref:uncharacterized protein LOC135827179 n=1 Tax=Sycon ciliatum TaxID=27933 RepID=UPI0031F69B8A
MLKPSPAMTTVERTRTEENVQRFQNAVASNIEGFESTAPLEEQWNSVQIGLTNAGTEVLGYARRNQPDWFYDQQDVLTLALFMERRLAYNKWVASGNSLDHAKVKTIRSKTRAEVHRAKTNWLRSFKGLCPITIPKIKDANGNLCSSVDAQCARWGGHFHTVLNIQSQYDPTVFSSLKQRPVADELAELPTAVELSRAISRLTNNKAPGESGILPEMVKHAGAQFHQTLLCLIHQIWRENQVPQAWKDAELVPIPKKGDLSLCDNWRGIALLDVVGKVVGRLIQNRLQSVAERELPESQCGFRRGRSCTDQIFSVYQSVEKLYKYEHRTGGFLVFIDLRKAYDSVPRQALWCGLRTLGVPDQLVDLIASFHTGMQARVRVGDRHTDPISVNNGLRQGCSISPVLFNLYFSLVFERWNAEMAWILPGGGFTFNHSVNGNHFNRPRTRHQSTTVLDVEFADDAALFAPTLAAAQLPLETFHRISSAFGLTINFSKTKFVRCQPCKEDSLDATLLKLEEDTSVRDLVEGSSDVNCKYTCCAPASDRGCPGVV